jgi:hypothetical protein
LTGIVAIRVRKNPGFFFPSPSGAAMRCPVKEKEYDYGRKPTGWLVKIVAGDKPTSPRHVAAKRELEKRQDQEAHGRWRKRLLIKVLVMIIGGTLLFVGRYLYYKYSG